MSTRDQVTAGTPLVCSDERHQTKVRGLEGRLEAALTRAAEAEEWLALSRSENTRLCGELTGARATIDHMSKAMSWISSHDRQGLDHLEEAQREARARESAVKQAQRWAARARTLEAAAAYVPSPGVGERPVGQFKAVLTLPAVCPPSCADGHMYNAGCLIDPHDGTGAIGRSSFPGETGWYFSCDAEGGCEGLVSHGHTSGAAARRALDRHVKREHASEESHHAS